MKKEYIRFVTFLPGYHYKPGEVYYFCSFGESGSYFRVVDCFIKGVTVVRLKPHEQVFHRAKYWLKDKANSMRRIFLRSP